MEPAPLRVALVDDEPLARERIRTLLAARDDVAVVAEAGDGDEAVAVLADAAPDLVFLDVQMPGVDGFGVLDALADALGPERLPAVVFVTAFDEYALRAFEVSALDYLLKPFDRARFEQALEKAVARLRADGAGGDRALRAFVEQMRAEHAAARQWLRWFVVRRGDRLSFVRAADVDWIDAEGNYARLHAGGKTHLVRETMKALEARLDPESFVRVHRSAIVNVDRIAHLEPYFHGEYVLTMTDGATLTSSRSYSARLRDLLR